MYEEVKEVYFVFVLGIWYEAAWWLDGLLWGWGLLLLLWFIFFPFGLFIMLLKSNLFEPPATLKTRRTLRLTTDK